MVGITITPGLKASRLKVDLGAECPTPAEIQALEDDSRALGCSDSCALTLMSNKIGEDELD